MAVTIIVPRKLDEAMITALSILVSKGNYYHDACSLCGIWETTLYDWLKQAEIDFNAGRESIFTRLHESLKRAKAEARSKMVAVVIQAAEQKRDWLPAITYLERTDPEHWGRKDRRTLDINEHKEITVTTVEVHHHDGMSQIVEGEAKELPPGTG